MTGAVKRKITELKPRDLDASLQRHRQVFQQQQKRSEEVRLSFSSDESVASYPAARARIAKHRDDARTPRDASTTQRKSLL